MTRSKLKEVVEKGVVCVVSFSLPREIKSHSWLFIDKEYMNSIVLGLLFERIMLAEALSSM